MTRVIEIPDLPGDGDPMEWGRQLPDGRRVIHPPYGPTRIEDRRPFLDRSEPRRVCAITLAAAGLYARLTPPRT